MLRLVLRHAVCAAMLVTIAVTPAEAHVIDLGTPAKASTAQTQFCGGQLSSVKEFRAYAAKVFKRSTISYRAEKKVRAMHICQHSWWARKMVARYHDRFISERQARMCSDFNPVACIRDASARYGTNFSWLLACANTEGGTSVDSYKKMNTMGSGAGGVFQFMESTFNATIRRMGLSPKPWLSAKWQAMAAAWKFKHDGTGEWTGAGC